MIIIVAIPGIYSSNTWYNSTTEQGNYWDDYKDKYPNAKRIWLKGIWDTPYEIPDGNNKDMYPLIRKWQDAYPYNINQAKQNNQQNSDSSGNNVKQSLNQLFFQILGQLIDAR
jgi:hypothetical protein